MSRSNYDDDLGGSELRLYRLNVERAIRGRRGQAFLREMLFALDALPNRELIDGALEDHGDVCAIGSVALRRGLDTDRLGTYADDPARIGRVFGIAASLAAEIAYINDEAGDWTRETPASRWKRVRRWVVSQIKPQAEGAP